MNITNFMKGLMAFVCITCISSCQDEEFGYSVTDVKIGKYTKDFENLFGKIDSNHDWAMSGMVNATISIPDHHANSKVAVYTSRPGNPDSRLVSMSSLSETGDLSFNYPKYLKQVFIEVTNENGVSLSNYYEVKNGVVETYNPSTPVTRATTDNNVGRSLVTTQIGKFNFNDKEFYDIRRIWGYGGDNQQWEYPYNRIDADSKGAFPLYQLTNYSYTVGDGFEWTIPDLEPILGYDGVFEEQCLASLSKGEGCAREEWQAELKPEEGIDFQMASAGPVTLQLMYGATELHNKFGYLYYQHGASMDQILSSPHYIVLEDATPQNLITYTGGFGKWNDIAENLLAVTDPSKTYVTEEMKQSIRAKSLVGTKIPLVYFDESGNSSYTFPAGTHIVFFEMMGMAYNNASQWGGGLRYSRPDMNKFYGYTMYEQHTPKPSSFDGAGDMRFITYSWGNNIIMGMEDTSDDDMNDLMFCVNGNFTNTPPDINPNKSKPETWTVACEDLGGTFDYDFNDLVFAVSTSESDTDSENAKVELIPLAAGGTLEAYIYYNDNNLGEIHAMLGGNITNEEPQVNVYGNPGGPYPAGNPIVLESSVSWDTDITQLIKDKIKVLVLQEEGEISSGYYITGNTYNGQRLPQLIILPAGWDWPAEGVQIDNIYPEFANWVADAGNTNWFAAKSEDTRYIKNPLPKVSISSNPGSSNSGAGSSSSTGGGSAPVKSLANLRPTQQTVEFVIGQEFTVKDYFESQSDGSITFQISGENNVGTINAQTGVITPYSEWNTGTIKVTATQASTDNYYEASASITVNVVRPSAPEPETPAAVLPTITLNGVALTDADITLSGNANGKTNYEYTIDKKYFQDAYKVTVKLTSRSSTKLNADVLWDWYNGGAKSSAVHTIQVNSSDIASIKSNGLKIIDWAIPYSDGCDQIASIEIQVLPKQVQMNFENATTWGSNGSITYNESGDYWDVSLAKYGAIAWQFSDKNIKISEVDDIIITFDDSVNGNTHAKCFVETNKDKTPDTVAFHAVSKHVVKWSDNLLDNTGKFWDQNGILQQVAMIVNKEDVYKIKSVVVVLK